VALAGDLMTGVIDAAMQLELKANYIRAAYTNGQTLTATGTVIDSGRRTATAEARCWTNTASSPMQRLLRGPVLAGAA
jgi:acyl-coenzyme A thioesterase PaaI-like protein